MNAKKPQEQRIRQIQDAALRCFSRKGYDETTMDEIVAESGLTKGGIYWYFKSKRDIFLSLLDRHVREEAIIIDKMVNEPISIEKFFGQLVPDSLKVHLHDRVIMPLFHEMAAEATRDRVLRRRLRSLIDEGIANIIPLLERAHKRGEIKKLDNRNLSLALGAFGYGLLLMYDISDRSLPVEEIWRDFSEWLLHGIKKAKKA